MCETLFGISTEGDLKYHFPGELWNLVSRGKKDNDLHLGLDVLQVQPGLALSQ